jgi:hypothetical protein
MFNEERESPLDHRLVQTKTTIHTQKSHDRLEAELAKQLQKYSAVGRSSFDELLKIVTLTIAKRNTNMREAITPSQRLSITLCYLATGNTFEDLKFRSAISPQSIGIIVLETCDAIIQGLKNYTQVRKSTYEFSNTSY